MSKRIPHTQHISDRLRQSIQGFFLFLLALTLCHSLNAQTLPGVSTPIPTTDGYVLDAYVAVPNNQGPGPFALVVMPSSWAMSYTEYVAEANVFAQRGYIVVSFSSRGFGTLCSVTASCGYIDIAGPPTVEDVSTVITWALANTPANPNAIGVAGVSYGAGLGLLAAENDPRIKAVAAMSTWASLENSLYANQTPSAQGIGLLSLTSRLLGKPGPLMKTVNDEVADLNFYDAAQTILPVVAVRDPITNVNNINAHGTAIFMANAFEDSLFTPNELIQFYNALTVPKMIMFAHGDHATAELLGIAGLPTTPWTTATDWFDYYLKGINNGVTNQLPIQLASQKNPDNPTWSAFPNWEALQQNATTYNLTKPTSPLPNVIPVTGGLTPGAGGTWTSNITGGFPTTATSGIAFLSGALTGFLDLPPPVVLVTIDRANAAVWKGPVLDKTQNLIGSPTLQITVTPNVSQFTLIAYLYSVNALGYGQLITHKPFTNRQATPGVPETIHLNLEATNWQMAAGSQLALVIDTVDLRYAGVTPLNAGISFSASTATPSSLTVYWQ